MRRILHISDLHFGRDRPELLEPLIRSINGLDPDLVAISGDFTQRARHWQFRAARAFLDRLEPPTLSVPGNHDTPLDNLFIRLLFPWKRYRAHIAQELEPEYHDDEIAVTGVNTVNHFAWQRGLARAHTIRRVCKAFAQDPRERMHVAMLHHPLEHLPEVRKQLTRGAGAALEALEKCGTDIVLSGHLHSWRAVPFETAGGILLVQAGTGLSTRGRGEPNDFNLLTLDGRSVHVDRYVAAPSLDAFTVADTARFVKQDGLWT